VSTTGKPDPARGERFLRKLLTEDPAHLDVASDEEVVRQMDAAGIQVKSVPTAEELMALAEKYAARDAALEAPVPAQKPAPVASPPARRMRPGPIVAAVALGALGVAALVNREAIVAYVKGEPIGPDRPWAPPTAPSTPQQLRAASIRGEAFAACEAQRWTECAGKLDEAAGLDPAGESEARVVSARRAVGEAMRVEENPDKPKLK
jgi:hypothetical protein